MRGWASLGLVAVADTAGPATANREDAAAGTTLSGTASGVDGPAGSFAARAAAGVKMRRIQESRSSNSEYMTGTSSSVRKVAKLRPQITAMAIGLHQAACSPPQYSSGLSCV